jgi:hypothetical protein
MRSLLAVLASHITNPFANASSFGALIAVMLCLAAGSSPAAAQSGQQFVGHVEDSSHASIVEATVTIHNEDTGEDVVAQTTKTGDYTVPYLAPGTYTITTVKAGFKEVSKTHISLRVDQTSKMDFTLPVGNVSETVTVASDGTQIELSKADRGEIIGNERIEEMPSDGRNYMVLFGLSPGTNNQSNPQYPRQQDNVSSNLHLTGVPQATVQENLDGGTNDTANGWAASNVPLDTITEFKVVLNPYDASYGRAGGGAVDVALKSGTNKIHGSLYEFARRPWLDAQSYQYDYVKSQPGETAPFPTQHKRDQFGLEADGPVYLPHLYDGRNKTFFTAQWEQAYENLPNTGGNFASLPNPQWLTGNFAGAQYFDTVTKQLQPLIIYDPLTPLITTVDPADGKTKQTRSPFPGNIIPQDRMDPVGLAIAQYYNQIAPNYNPGAGQAPFSRNHYYLPIETDISRNGLVKFDQNFGSKDRGTIRWTGFERYDSSSPDGQPTSSPTNSEFVQFQPREQQYSIEEIHTFSPNLVLDNKLTAGTEAQGITQGSTGFNLTKLGFSQHYISNVLVTNQFPNITASGVQGSSTTDFLGLAPGTTGGYSAVHNLGYQPSVTFIRGRHTFRAGFDMRLYQFADVDNAQNNQFRFQNYFTQHYYNSPDAPGMSSGNSIAELLLGAPYSGSLIIQSSPFFSQHYYAFWAQDDWKLTSKLTFSLGIRYDLLGARTERHNEVNYGFDTTDVNPLNAQITNRTGLNGPLLGGTEFAGVNGAPRGAYATNLLNIQPRFGAAYAFNSRTSLRAGFGEMFIQDEANDHQNGFQTVTNFNNSLNNGISPSLNNPCVPGNAGCGPVTPGSTLADPYASTVKPAGSALGLATTPGSSINFSDPHFQVPSLWQFSVSVDRQLTSRDVLDISYSGLKGYNLEGSDNINHPSAASYAKCNVEQGGNRQLCDGNSYPAAVPNPFYMVPGFAGSGGYYSNPTIPAYNLTRPFPEFTDVTEDHLPQIHSWYNSLQLTVSHHTSHNLDLHFAYTWSKSMTAGNIIDPIYRVYGRTIGANDIPNAITFSGVFYFPFGRGKTFLSNTNRLVDAVVGGWELSPLYVYTQWYPFSPGTNWEQMSSIYVKPHDLPADATHPYKRLQGVTPCVAYHDTDTGAIIDGPSYIEAGCKSPALIETANQYVPQRNVVYWGVRLPANHQFDVSLSKRFAWNERANLQLRLDAFNVLNHPNWTFGDNYSTDPTNDNFGTIQKGPESPSGSLPRDLQLSGKITF